MWRWLEYEPSFETALLASQTLELELHITGAIPSLAACIQACFVSVLVSFAAVWWLQVHVVVDGRSPSTLHI